MAGETPSLSVVMASLTGFQRTAAVKAAIELDVFSAIGEGVETPAALGVRCGAAERGVRALCDRLVVDGLLAKEAGRYRLTPTATVFLDRRSPAYVGAAATFLTAPTVMQAFADLTAAVRRGGTAIPGDGTLAPEHPVWVDFARAMAGTAAFTAEVLLPLLDLAAAPRLRVLDLAAGHGMYGIAAARHDPRAEITAVDWPNVLAVAREHATAAGVAERMRWRPGSAFAVDLGEDYDLVLITNFLHHFDPPTCERFLRRVHAALAPGGRAVAVEFVPNADRVSPPEAAAFSLVMLASTPHGDAYTFAEYERMFRAAGFASLAQHALPPTPQTALVAER